ncbi:MAG: hypothetical protein O3B04_09830 [Chloroflexi bacterium]|nr:hypothetical protein [Chloroflexota bacterium]MDA1298274.1 hypothetical protein [Chloroflexota bacterium]
MSRQVMTAIRHIGTPGWLSGAGRHATKAAAVLGALALIVAMAVPATSRASADHSPLQAVFGTVLEVSIPDVITVATDSGIVRLIVPDSDVFTGDVTSIEDVSEGDRVIASVHVGTDGTTTVDRLLVIPDLTQTVTRHILGVILDSRDGAVTVQDRDGNTITIYVPEGVVVPAAGTVVTAVAQLDRASGRLLAQAFDLVEDAVQRLQDARDRNEGSEFGKELEERLERARDQHLSALERARESLERARQAVASAVAERAEAERRLAEVQAKFDDLRQRYVQEASDRNERQPELLITGTLTYSDDAWLEPEGTFTISPRGNSQDDGVSRTFSWSQKTLAILPVEVRSADASSTAIITTVARSVAVSLNDVKSLIPSGSQVRVQYDPNTDPVLATLLTVLPPELPKAIEDALRRERLRSVSGFITLVEEAPGLDAAIGVLVVANREHDLKVAAKVTEATTIELDGEPAWFGQLAAGMAVEVEFAAVQVTGAASTAATVDGRLNALRVRAWTIVDRDDVYVAGVIVGVDLDTRTVGIQPREGDVVRARVVDDAVIVKDGVRGRFAALETGDLVLDATRYNRSTLVLTRLVVQSPRAITFSGAITGIDRNPDRLTVSTSDGRALTVFVTAETGMRTESGARLQLSDLAVGDRVLKGSVLPVQRDGRTVDVAQELVIGQPSVTTARGIVSRISADAGQIRVEVRADSAGSGQLDLSVAENNRSALSKNGERIKDLSSVLPGDIVESVSYVTATGIIVKMSVASPNLQRVRGVVSVVTGSGLAIETSNGRNVGLSVNGETVITLNGRRVSSLSGVDRGDVVAEAVYIASAGDSAVGVALRLTLFDRLPVPGASVSPTDPDGSEPATPTVETTISGVIEAISLPASGGDTWVIGGRKFLVTSGTQFFGEKPQLGLVAKATLRREDRGEFVAVAISVAGRPDTNPSARPVEIKPVEPGDTPDDTTAAGLVRILGKVQAVDKTAAGAVVVLVDGVKITILPGTVVAGEPEVGAGALAVVRRSASGIVTAVSIIYTRAVRPDSTVTSPVTATP